MNNERYTGTQAVQRALLVLKSFGPDTAPLTPAQLSQRTGLNRSTVYRLLSVLEREGMVAVDQQGHYRLGPELVALGGLAQRQIDLRSVALPLLHTLAEKSGETVDLELLRGNEVMIVEEVAGDHLLSTSANVGRTYPAHCTATGKVLLAHLPVGRLEVVLAGELCACGPQTHTDSQILRSELALVRKRGYAAAYEELEAHLHAIGAPVRNHAGDVVAAVSISGLSVRMPRSREGEYAAMVIGICEAISERMGYKT